MSLFDQVMDQVFRAVREDRLPVAYQFSAARMIDERQVPAVAEWLADATKERIRETLEHIVFAGSWCDDGATIQAIQTVQQNQHLHHHLGVVCRGPHVTRSIVLGAYNKGE